MATPKKQAPPQLAASRVVTALDSVEFAKAVQDPEFDLSGYPQTCQRFIDNPELIRNPLWTDFLFKIIKQHVAEHPLQNPSSLDVAFMVDYEMLFGKPFEAVVTKVAEATGKSTKAVRKAHDRFGKRRA